MLNIDSKYKYLSAWAIFTHSTQSWLDNLVEEARRRNVDDDVVFKTIDNHWISFNELTSEENKRAIQNIVLSFS